MSSTEQNWMGRSYGCDSMKTISVEEFVEKANTHNTKINYRSHLNNYFEFIGTEPPHYFTSKRDYNKDFEDYAQHIKNMSSCTRKMRLNCIKKYLKKNNVTIDEDVIDENLKRIRMRKQTVDEIPTPEILKEILEHGTTKDRALFLFCASSGCRISEVLQLTKDDIPAFKQMEQHKPIETPIKVSIPASITKNRMSRITYISQEAWETLLEWLKERDVWLQSACRKSKEYKDKVDPRLFPHLYPCAAQSWYRLVRKARHDDRDRSNKNEKFQRRKYHIHMLRAYFKNRLLEAGIQERYIEILMGHIGYVGGAYDKIFEPQLRKAYEKGEPYLSVYTIRPDMSGFHEDLKKKEEEINRLKADALEMRLAILELKEKLNGKK